MSSTLSKEETYRANFLWGFPDESIEALGYEFANGKTEPYLKEVWEQLVQTISEQESRKEVEGYEIWKKQQGVMWNVRNITTPPNELYDLYLQSKQKQ